MFFLTISKSHFKRNILIYSICVTFVIIYLIFQYNFTSNIPFGDDLPTIFHFIFKLNRSSTLNEKFDLVFKNGFLEHKLLFSSLITSFLYTVTKQISLQVIAVAAGIIWSSLFLFYNTWIKNTAIPSYWLVVVTLVLFSVATYQAMFWTMAALQHFSVTFLCFLCVFLLCKSPTLTVPVFLLASLTAFIGTFSSGNGMGIWPAGFLALLLRRELKFMLAWLVTACSSVLFYFYSINLGDTPSHSNFTKVFDSLFIKVINLITGLGGATHLNSEYLDFWDGEPAISARYLATYCGIAILALFFIGLREAYLKKNRGLIGITSVSLFIIITYAFVSFGRSSSQSVFVIFKSRYYTYSLIAIINALFCLAYFAKNIKHQKLVFYLCLASTLYFWTMWQFSTYTNLLNQKNSLSISYLNFIKNKSWTCYQPTYYYGGYYDTFFKDNPADVALPATDLLTAFDKKEISSHGFYSCSDLNIQNEVTSNLVKIHLYNDKSPAIHHLNEGYAITMISKTDTFFLYSMMFRNSVKQFLKIGTPTRNGYLVNISIRKDRYPKGNYQLHQFYFQEKKGILNPKSEGSITL